ncbi:TPA: ATP-binding cassette domain-containing protein [Streptococcus suis]|nr:ATP-binding cassette domain-containing protein [Streptococcus suis]
MNRENVLLRIEGMSKVYGQQAAVDQVSFAIQRGEICGLVGQNGAGKTTLIRILSGLIFPSAGQLVFPNPVKMGAIIESPTLYPNMSAWDNLMYAALQLSLENPKERIQQVLDLVGLGDVDRKKKVKNFSLGMRQRMSIALAIIDFPEFLILDEPINGLDPSGIKEVRDIILRLRDEYGMTVLISSHILSELELLADRFVIMHKGKVIRDLTKADLAAVVARKLYLDTADNAAVKAYLEEKGLEVSLEEAGLVLDADEHVQSLIDLVGQSGIEILEIYRQGQHLEEYYLSLLSYGGVENEFS